MSNEASEYARRGLDGLPQPDEPNQETLLHWAYGASSYIHELRHFYDQFGTLAGISLFSSFIETLKSFAAAAHRVALSGGSWQWPVTDWVKYAECPSEVRTFIRHLRAFRAGAQCLLGTHQPLEMDGHLAEHTVEGVNGFGQTVDLAVLRFEVLQNDKRHPKTLLYPLGVETLFESSAHAISRTLVEHCFPIAVAEQFAQDRTELREEGSPGEHILPYMILDRRISRFMRENGHTTFPRDIVLGVADEALSRSSLYVQRLNDKNTAAHIRDPSKLIQDILENTPIEDLVNGNVNSSPETTDVYEHCLEQWEQGGDWDTVEDSGSLLSSILIWESYTAQHFAVPLLRRRLAGQHRAFRSIKGFFEILNLVPPPALSFRGNMQLDMPPRVQRAWADVLLTGQTMMALLDGSSLHCPRAYRTVPGLNNVAFADHPGCDTFMSLGCGRFDGTRIKKTPCMFVSGLRGLAFIP